MQSVNQINFQLDYSQQDYKIQKMERLQYTSFNNIFPFFFCTAARIIALKLRGIENSNLSGFKGVRISYGNLGSINHFALKFLTNINVTINPIIYFCDIYGHMSIGCKNS